MFLPYIFMMPDKYDMEQSNKLCVHITQKKQIHRNYNLYITKKSREITQI